MRDYLRKLKPTCIDDLIAMKARYYRPGPLGSNMVDDFIGPQAWPQEDRISASCLADILKEYIRCYRLSGTGDENRQCDGRILLPWNRRSAPPAPMGKKKAEVMVQMRTQFIQGAKGNGTQRNHRRRGVRSPWLTLPGTVSTSPISAGYAIIAFQTAWLKVTLSAEFNGG